jgi:quercetin dioxygenase-like cupin family protein
VPRDEQAVPVTRDVVLDVALPGLKSTDRVEVRRITMTADYRPGAHVHNGPVFGSIVSGSVWFELAGEEASLLVPGDVFYEPEGVVVTRFDAGPDGATFLGYFLLEAGQQPELTMTDG